MHHLESALHVEEDLVILEIGKCGNIASCAYLKLIWKFICVALNWPSRVLELCIWFELVEKIWKVLLYCMTMHLWVKSGKT